MAIESLEYRSVYYLDLCRKAASRLLDIALDGTPEYSAKFDQLRLLIGGREILDLRGNLGEPALDFSRTEDRAILFLEIIKFCDAVILELKKISATLDEKTSLLLGELLTEFEGITQGVKRKERSSLPILYQKPVSVFTQPLRLIFQKLLAARNARDVASAGRVSRQWYCISRENTLWFPFFKAMHEYPEKSTPKIEEGLIYQLCMRDLYVVCGYVQTRSGDARIPGISRYILHDLLRWEKEGVPKCTKLASLDELNTAVTLEPNQVFAHVQDQIKKARCIFSWDNPLIEKEKPITCYEENEFPAFFSEDEAIALSRALPYYSYDGKISTLHFPVVAKAKCFEPIDLSCMSLTKWVAVKPSQIKIFAVKQVNTGVDPEIDYVKITPTNKSGRCVIA